MQATVEDVQDAARPSTSKKSHAAQAATQESSAHGGGLIPFYLRLAITGWVVFVLLQVGAMTVFQRSARSPDDHPDAANSGDDWMQFALRPEITPVIQAFNRAATDMSLPLADRLMFRDAASALFYIEISGRYSMHGVDVGPQRTLTFQIPDFLNGGLTTVHITLGGGSRTLHFYGVDSRGETDLRHIEIGASARISGNINAWDMQMQADDAALVSYALQTLVQSQGLSAAVAQDVTLLGGSDAVLLLAQEYAEWAIAMYAPSTQLNHAQFTQGWTSLATTLRGPDVQADLLAHGLDVQEINRCLDAVDAWEAGLVHYADGVRDGALAAQAYDAMHAMQYLLDHRSAIAAAVPMVSYALNGTTYGGADILYALRSGEVFTTAGSMLNRDSQIDR